jgi:hypothetical protein
VSVPEDVNDGVYDDDIVREMVNVFDIVNELVIDSLGVSVENADSEVVNVGVIVVDIVVVVVLVLVSVVLIV